MCSAAGHVAQRFGFPLLAVFHRFFVTKPVRSETSKAETVVNLATIVLLGLVAHRFFWLSERAYGRVRDWGARSTQRRLCFRCWASKHTPLFHTIRTMVVIFLAKVRRAISGRMPLVNKAAKNS
jgi:hypothetical protein